MTAAPVPTSALTRLRGLVVVLALIAVVLLVVSGFYALRVRDDPSASAERVQQDRAAVLGVARQQAANLTSLSSTDLEAALDRVRGLSTGRFLDELNKTVAALQSQLAKAPFDQKGNLIDAGVSELDGNKASVVIALDQTVSSGQRSRTDALRLRVDLLRADAHAAWLVDNVIFQPSTISAQVDPAPSAGPTATPTPSATP